MDQHAVPLHTMTKHDATHPHEPDIVTLMQLMVKATREHAHPKGSSKSDIVNIVLNNADVNVQNVPICCFTYALRKAVNLGFLTMSCRRYFYFQGIRKSVLDKGKTSSKKCKPSGTNVFRCTPGRTLNSRPRKNRGNKRKLGRPCIPTRHGASQWMQWKCKSRGLVCRHLHSKCGHGDKRGRNSRVRNGEGRRERSLCQKKYHRWKRQK